MPTRDGYREGIPCWVDLATGDVETALGFYSELFGWRFDAPDDEAMQYWMAYKDDLSAAGVGPTPDGRSFSAWTTYLAVDEADVTASRIREAGGQLIMEPIDVYQAGRLAIAGDPTGAVFGIWESREHRGAQIVNEHGALNWNELQTSDIDTAVAFYESVFGYSHRTTDGANGRYVLLAVADREVAGVMSPPAPGIPDNWGVYFAVDDAQAALTTTKAAGGSVITGTMEIPDIGTFAVLVDPTGAPFTVIQLASAVD